MLIYKHASTKRKTILQDYLSYNRFYGVNNTIIIVVTVLKVKKVCLHNKLYGKV